MSIHHQLDFVLRIVDAMTDRVVKGGVNRFWLNDQPIKPVKVMDHFFIFTNVFTNPKHFHVYSDPDAGVITWENPYYLPIKIRIPLKGEAQLKSDEAYFIRALPSLSYPFSQAPTAIQGCILGAQEVQWLHTCNRNHYLLKGPIVNEKYVELAQSMDRNLEGKCFRFLGEEKLQTRMVLTDGHGTYVTPAFEKDPPQESDLLEVIRVPISATGHFFMVLHDMESEWETKEIELEISDGQQIKHLKTIIKKGIINDAGTLDFKTL